MSNYSDNKFEYPIDQTNQQKNEKNDIFLGRLFV